jgi:hypothetical protein
MPAQIATIDAFIQTNQLNDTLGVSAPPLEEWQDGTGLRHRRPRGTAWMFKALRTGWTRLALRPIIAIGHYRICPPSSASEDPDPKILTHEH